MKNLLAWGLCTMMFFIISCAPKSGEGSETATTAADSTAATAPAEFADQKYADVVRTGLDNLSKGDVNAWLSSMSEDARYYWNNGDSLVGKAAISEYWTKRRAEAIDSLTYANVITLPIKVNKPQAVESPGTWVLAWYQVTAKYKASGKKMTQWIHFDAHFNEAGQIDQLFQYVDFAKINEAMKK